MTNNAIVSTGSKNSKTGRGKSCFPSDGGPCFHLIPTRLLLFKTLRTFRPPMRVVAETSRALPAARHNNKHPSRGAAWTRAADHQADFARRHKLLRQRDDREEGRMTEDGRKPADRDVTPRDASLGRVLGASPRTRPGGVRTGARGSRKNMSVRDKSEERSHHQCERSKTRSASHHQSAVGHKRGDQMTPLPPTFTTSAVVSTCPTLGHMCSRAPRRAEAVALYPPPPIAALHQCNHANQGGTDR